MSSQVEHITGADLSLPIAPYSPGVRVGDLVFTCQGPIAPGGTDVVGTTTSEQLVQTLLNVESVLAKVGASRRDIIKMTLFLADMDDYADMNVAYRDFFEGLALPTRLVVEVSRLPHGLLLEAEAVAVLPG